MNNRPPTQPEPPAGLNVGDIYYVVFRHKWKILILSLMGILAAIAYYFAQTPPYQSQAELWIQYVQQPGNLSAPGNDKNVILADARGLDVINTEIRIMTSLDLAQEAATNLVAAGIFSNLGVTNIFSAAGIIRRGLSVEPAGYGSSTIVITYTHPDPTIVQPVLRELIGDYFQRQKEIHSASSDFDEGPEPGSLQPGPATQ